MRVDDLHHAANIVAESPTLRVLMQAMLNTYTVSIEHYLGEPFTGVYLTLPPDTGNRVNAWRLRASTPTAANWRALFVLDLRALSALNAGNDAIAKDEITNLSYRIVKA